MKIVSFSLTILIFVVHFGGIGAQNPLLLRGDLTRGTGFTHQELLDILQIVQKDVDHHEIIERLMNKDGFLRLLPDILQNSLSPEEKKELIISLQEVNSHSHSAVQVNTKAISSSGYNDVLNYLITSVISDSKTLGGNTYGKLPSWVIKQIIEYIENNWQTILAELLVKLHELLDQILSEYYLPIGENVNEECRNLTGEFFMHVFDEGSSILKMVDSWGKLPDGYLFGNLMTMGMYEECVQSETTYVSEQLENDTVSYSGRYCLVTYSLPSNTSALDIFGELALAHGLFGYGTCIPSTCSGEDLWTSLNETLAGLELTVGSVHCQAKHDGGAQLTSLDKTMLSLIAIFLSLVVVGTIWDVATRVCNIVKMRQNFWRFPVEFSFWQNLRYVFIYKKYNHSDRISCLCALRVITMTWIIICHQYEVDALFVRNLFDSTKYQDPVVAQIVTNGWLSADTFFCLTGIVIAYRLFPYIKLGRYCSVLVICAKTFVRRFIRLSPSILFVALFSSTLLRYLAVGPVSYRLDNFADQCRNYWWRDALFANNYLYGDDGVVFKDCLHHCWYTAVDMQLVLVLPFLLVPFTIKRQLGVLAVCVTFLGSIIAPMIITIINKLPPSPIHDMSLEEHFEYSWRVYLVPWCRAGPWLVGFFTGYLLRHPGISKVKIHRLVVFGGYILAISLGLLIVLGLFPFNHVWPDEDYQDYPAMSAIYGSLARPLWGICVAFVVFCCHTGNSEVVNKILSYQGWQPLARVTLAMFLVSPVVQKWWLAGRLTLNYYNYLEKLIESAGIFFLSGLIALALTCFVERPICSFVNALLPSEAIKTARRDDEQELLKLMTTVKDPRSREMTPVKEYPVHNPLVDPTYMQRIPRAVVGGRPQ